MDEKRKARFEAMQLAPDYVPARLRLGEAYLKSNQSGPAAAEKFKERGVYDESRRSELGGL